MSNNILIKVKRCNGLFIRKQERGDVYVYRGSPRCVGIHGGKVVIGKVSSFPTSKDAYKKCQDLEDEAALPNAEDRAEATCQDLFDKYLKHEERRVRVLKEITQGTYDEKEWVINKYLSPHFKDLSPKDLERCDRAWDKFVDKNHSIDLTNPRKVFKSFLTWAYENEYINRQPKLKIPDYEYRKGKDLGMDIVWNMHECCTHQDLKDFIAISAMTGARKMEILRLTKDRIKVFADGVKGFVSKDYRSQTKQPRNVPVNEQVWRILQRRAQESQSNWIFWNRENPSMHLTPTSLTKAWKNLCKELDLEDVRINDLRTTHANELARQKVSEELRDKILGHSREVASKHYEILKLKELQVAADAVKLSHYQPKPKLVEIT